MPSGKAVEDKRKYGCGLVENLAGAELELALFFLLLISMLRPFLLPSVSIIFVDFGRHELRLLPEGLLNTGDGELEIGNLNAPGGAAG